jgi:hypothetical protein
MLIVRFVSDWSLYAAGDQAAFVDQVAMGLQQRGIAMVQGPVDRSQQLDLQLQSVVPAMAPVAAEDKRRK